MEGYLDNTVKTEKQIGVALVGCGAISYANAEAIRISQLADLIYAVDVNYSSAEKLGKKYGVAYTAHLEEAISNPLVDVVFICTPHYLHAPIAEQAAQAGKHVIVEKPMGVSLADARKIQAVCAEKQVLLSVCYCMRYWSAVRQARQLIEDGGLGKILGTEMMMIRDRSESYLGRNTWQEANPNWHGDRARAGGGMFFDNFSHYLDYFHFLTDLDIEWIFARADTRLIPADVEDSLFALCGYENGASGMVLSGSTVRGAGKEGSLRPLNSMQRIWGEYGQIVLQPDFSFYSLKRIGGYAPNCWHHLSNYRGKAAGAGLEERRSFVDMFARAVQEGLPLEITGEDGLRVMAVMDAVYRSSAAGSKEPVKIIQTAQSGLL